jgi:hypothetical protein
MQVQDIDGTYEVKSIPELETILRRRDESGANAFWLSPDAGRYPMLSLLVKGDLAALHFLPKEREAGCRSVGKLTNGETTRFHISKHRADDVHVINDSLIPVSAALVAAQEFFSSNEVPQSVEWLWL